MSTQRSEIHHEEKDLPFLMSDVPEFFRRKCEIELNETPERKKQAIQELRKLLAKDKITKDICFHDDFLVQYLRHSKYNINKAINHLRNFCVLRNKETKMFEGSPDEYFSTKPSTKAISVLPKRCPDGCSMILYQVGKWNPSELSLDYVKRIILMTYVQCLRDPMSQINGFKGIFDFEGSNLEHLKCGTPKNLYFLHQVAICCIPGRYREIHFINESPVLKIVWSIVKMFLSYKIKNRVFFHSGPEGLLKHFPKSVLPVEYGGEVLDSQATHFVQTANKEQKKYTIEGQPNFY